MTVVEPPGNAAEDEAREEVPADERSPGTLPGRIEAREEDVDSGVAELVLTLVELVRRVLEKEAVRRMEAGTLTDEEVERVGTTLMRLEERMDDLKEIFDLTDQDLDLDLGPLSRLL